MDLDLNYFKTGKKKIKAKFSLANVMTILRKSTGDDHADITIDLISC